MSRLSATRAIAEAAATMTRDYDLPDALSSLVRACAESLSIDAIGVLLVGEDGQLELLSATSHRVAELELYQVQQEVGPCLDAIHGSEVVTVSGEEDIRRRWPDVGEAILGTGFGTVSAFPMRWHGFTLGAMNAFEAGDEPMAEDDQLLAQTFADIAAVLILQNTEVSQPQVTERVQAALQSRTAIERAKGVLAYQDQLDMGEAYDRLLDLAARDGASLAGTAERVIEDAQHRRP